MARTKNRLAHEMPLSELAIAELDHVAGGERWPRDGFVLTTTGKTPVSGFSKVKLRLDALVNKAMGRPMPGWRLHDLRRTFATNMQRLGVRFEVTEALLNHRSGARGGVSGIYQQHDWAPEKEEAVGPWAERLRTLMSEENIRRFDVAQGDQKSLQRRRVASEK